MTNKETLCVIGISLFFVALIMSPQFISCRQNADTKPNREIIQEYQEREERKLLQEEQIRLLLLEKLKWDNKK